MSHLLTSLPLGLQEVFKLRAETGSRRARAVEAQWDEMGVAAMQREMSGDRETIYTLLKMISEICHVSHSNVEMEYERLVSEHPHDLVRIAWLLYCSDIYLAKKIACSAFQKVQATQPEPDAGRQALQTGQNDGRSRPKAKNGDVQMKSGRARLAAETSTTLRQHAGVILGSPCSASSSSTPRSIFGEKWATPRLLSATSTPGCHINTSMTDDTAPLSAIPILPLPVDRLQDHTEIGVTPEIISTPSHQPKKKRRRNVQASVTESGKESAALPPERPGIPSSKFARVMRLIAGVPPITPSRPAIKLGRPKKPPPVWAESRQELCEALPYYRAFQSGLYMSRRIAYGYLLEAFPAPRDVWAHGGRVVISHGGGQCIQTIDKDGKRGLPALSADQSPNDARVDTLLHACEARIPIILIAGEGYGFLPWDLGCAYAILGWYWICYTWVEAEPVAEGVAPPKDRDYFHRVKIRFDWVDSQGTPWWLKDEAETSKVGPNCARRERPVGWPTPIVNGSSPALASTNVTPVSISVIAQGHRTPSSSSAPFLPNILTRSAEQTHSTSSAMDRSRKLPGTRLLDTSRPIVTGEDELKSLFTSISKPCPSCHTSTPKVYAEGWICLTPTCSQFWLLATDIGLLPIVPGFNLSLDENFLRPLRTPQDVQSPPYDVRPPLPFTGAENEEESAGMRTLWKGWVCDDCGRANCRYRWEVWECRNCGKQIAHLGHQQTLSANRLASDIRHLMGDIRLSGIKTTFTRIDSPYSVVCGFELPDGSGRIYHVKPDSVDHADEVFQRYQVEAACTKDPLFQRRALRAGTVKGQLLAQHFAVNSGANYKYNVDTLSLTFEESPSCVRQALQMITEGVGAVIGEKVKFNEVLSVLYREGQKMSWHDDGEEGLGPVVASLSLGSDATMSWRPKKGRTLHNLPYYKGEKRGKVVLSPEIALSITLSHGDMVIMQGHELQERYSHRVVPDGFRVAATARVINT